MKKTLILIFSVFVVLSITACGKTTTPPAQTPSEVTSNPVEETRGETDVSNADISKVSDIKEFPLDLEGTISNLNASLEKEGIVLADPVASPGESPEMGKHTAYTYSLGEGAYLCIYVSDNTGNILNFTVLTIDPEIDKDTLYNVGYVIGCLEGGLAGKDAYRVDEELNIGNLTEDAFSTSSTDFAEFLYMVQEGSLVFMATPA